MRSNQGICIQKPLIYPHSTWPFLGWVFGHNSTSLLLKVQLVNLPCCNELSLRTHLFTVHVLMTCCLDCDTFFCFFVWFYSVLCCTLNAVPETKSLLTKSKLPLGIHLHPFKDLQVSSTVKGMLWIVTTNEVILSANMWRVSQANGNLFW